MLKPWPHLVKLFLHFLTPQDCTEINMVSRIGIIDHKFVAYLIQLAEKADLESAESFAKRLQVGLLICGMQEIHVHLDIRKNLIIRQSSLWMLYLNSRI